MELGDISLACASSLVAGLADGGVRHAAVSPGSRSTALALALARDPRVQVHVQLDERSGGFFALGAAKVTGRPAIVACTSGTAAAELLPAVVEAAQARVPLVVLTADRPPRLRGTGANQTIVQPGLYGEYVHASFDLPVPSTAGQEAWWRQAAREALEAMATDPTGPVHLNCPFEEPLTPTTDTSLIGGDVVVEAFTWPVRPAAELDPDEADRLAQLVSGARGAVVFGGWPGHPSSEGQFWAELLGWPVLAEPTSGTRQPETALAAGQAMIAGPWAEAHRPELVIQFGASPTSRAAQRFVASAEHLVVADRWHLDPDPDHLASWRLAVDPEALPNALARHPVIQGSGIALTGRRSKDEIEELWHGRIHPAPLEWTAEWRAADERARDVLDGLMDGWDEPFEPRIARDTASWIPDAGRLFVGNSTPIRDLDLAMRPRANLTVMANRGASGIDGLVSTALGIAVARHGPVVALVGDLSFLHDAGAVLWNASRDVDLIVVVVNNGGGHVFSLLPQRDLPEHRELFVTPHTVDIGGLCGAAGADHERVERAPDLLPALDRAAGAGRGIRVVEVVVDAELGLRRRAELRSAVDAALGGS
ncbi:MAG TPA: 2-succinyl-5-enolpyruvyl-6-hydroxy-3-cyclohexene-1-carboxylic-acid synthase [Actinomycetota bacterium]|nr:2-succinyl-5-enolpyruvyl-6-hydroxy-3-cyclohexene-1-carboxylic-acid synthase [Actinomycetota bacterium]